MEILLIIAAIVIISMRAKKISKTHMDIWNEGLNALAVVTTIGRIKHDDLLYVSYVGNDRNEHNGTIRLRNNRFEVGDFIPVKYLPSDYEHTISPLERWFKDKVDPNPIYQ